MASAAAAKGKAHAKAEAAAHFAENVATHFEALVRKEYEALQPAERDADHLGKLERHAECADFLEAAHRWGLHYIRAADVTRRELFALPAHQNQAMTALLRAQGSNAESEKANYVQGYKLWFLCARTPSLVAARTEAPPERTDLVEYTKQSNGRSAKDVDRNQATPRSGPDLTRAAWASFRFHQDVLEPRRRNAQTVAAAVKTLAAEPAAAAGPGGGGGGGGASSSSSARPGPYDRPPSGAKPKPKPTPAPRSVLGPIMLAPDANAGLDERASPPMASARSLAQFLEVPRRRLTFEATDPEIVRRLVYDHVLTQDQVMRVVRRQGDGDTLLPPAPEFLSTAWTGRQLAERLVRPHGMHELFKDDPVAGTNHHAAPKPPGFENLGLHFVGRGSYNSVWTRHPDEPKEDARKRLQEMTVINPQTREPEPVMHKQLAHDLASGSTVMRIPAHDNWCTLEEVGEEMINMTEAALRTYGPLIAAMWVVKKHQQTAAAGEDARFKLFTIMQKGQMDVGVRLSMAQWLVGSQLIVEDKLARAYLGSLRLCIWNFSADCCVHTDAKLSNFIDTCGPEPLSSESKIGALSVRVIDMDAGVFRRLARVASSANENGHQGWRAVWLHNILFVSCFLKSQLPEHVFMTFWWRPITVAVSHTMGLLLRDEKSLREDAEFKLASRFVYESRWAHGFHLGQSLPATPPGSAPEAIGRTAVLMAVYYFHDVWERAAWDKYGVHARAYRAAVTALGKAAAQAGVRPDDASLETMRKELETARRRWAVARGWFDQKYRTQGPPQFRFFEERMELHDARQAPLLVAVMHEYAATSTSDLLARYVEGAAFRGNGPARPTWPRVPTSAEHDGVDWDNPEQRRAAFGFVPTPRV